MALFPCPLVATLSLFAACLQFDAHVGPAIRTLGMADRTKLLSRGVLAHLISFLDLNDHLVTVQLVSKLFLEIAKLPTSFAPRLPLPHRDRAFYDKLNACLIERKVVPDVLCPQRVYRFGLASSLYGEISPAQRCIN